MFNWAEYLELAEALVGVEPQEAAWLPRRGPRLLSGIEEAAFKSAYNFLCAEGVRFPAVVPGSHMDVWRRFRGSGPARRSVGVKGDRLRRRRTGADYDGSKTIVRKDVDYAIQEAKYVLATLKAIEAAKKRDADRPEDAPSGC